MPASSGLCSQARVRRPDGAAGHAVGFVASAGGVVALGDVLRGLPADLDAAVIVVLHLLPDHRSHLAEILARQTHLQVKEAARGDLLEPGWVYVAPPDAHLVVEEDATLSLRAEAPVRYLRPSGDVLLESLASRIRRQLHGGRADRPRQRRHRGVTSSQGSGREGTRPGRGDGGVLRDAARRDRRGARRPGACRSPRSAPRWLTSWPRDDRHRIPPSRACSSSCGTGAGSTTRATGGRR